MRQQIHRVARTVGGAVLAAALVAGAASAEEADLSGEWTLTIDGKTPPGKNFAVLHFAGTGGELTVTMSGKGGDVTGPVTVEDGVLRWEHSGKKGVVAVFTGRTRGDLMGGEVDMGSRGTSPWLASRAGSADLSGTWTFIQKGQPVDYVNLTKLQFYQRAEKLVAEFTTGDVVTVCEGHLQGDEVGFAYHRETHDGKVIDATYSARVAGDLIQGTVDMGELGQSTWRATRDQ